MRMMLILFGRFNEYYINNFIKAKIIGLKTC